MGKTMDKYHEKMSPQELELLFEETDRDKDGRVDFKDFMRMMMSK
jgi:Ca2+-binding EF-hand superfamily protein